MYICTLTCKYYRSLPASEREEEKTEENEIKTFLNDFFLQLSFFFHLKKMKKKNRKFTIKLFDIQNKKITTKNKNQNI